MGRVKSFLVAAALALAGAVGAAEPMYVTLTFDDGPKGNVTEVAPLLEKHGWRGTFNIVVDRVGRDDRHVTWDDVRELHRRGHEIASHTWTHPHLAKLYAAGATNRLHREIFEARDRLAKEVGVAPQFLCHPYCETTPEVDALIRSAGLTPMGTRRYLMTSKSKPGKWAGAKATIERELGKKTRRPRAMDVLFHGTSPTSGGWEAMTGERDFEGLLDEIAALEQEGRIKVVSYREFLDKVTAKD